MARNLKAIIPAVLGLALASSLLVGPPAQATDTAPTETLAVNPVANVVMPVASSGWKLVRNYEFDGSALDDEWAPRNEGSYEAYGRNCAAPYANNVTISGGTVKLKVTKGTKANVKSAKAAKCKTTKYKVYRNAMIGTQNSFGLSSGIIAARVKFPRTRGLHSGVWLRSATSEIDMVEAYGYPRGRGITHAWHGYFAKRVIKEYKRIGSKSKAWWSQYHVYSVEWDSQKVIFRIDGSITKAVSRGSSYYPPSNETYFLVISALTSEFDQRTHRMSSKELKATTTSVDWVKAWVPGS